MKYVGSTASDGRILDHFLPYRTFPVPDRLRFAVALACRAEITSFSITSSKGDIFEGKGPASLSDALSWTEGVADEGVSVSSAEYETQQGSFFVSFPDNGEIIVSRGRRDYINYKEILDSVEEDFKGRTGSFPLI